MKKSHPQKKYTLAGRFKPTHEPKLAREYFFLLPKKNFSFFSPTLRCFNFFETAQPTTDKHSDGLMQTLTRDCNLTRTTEARTANSVLPQLAVICKIEAKCSYQAFLLVDNEVLQNRQLLQHAKRWR
ncbi:MAG TPA: hypothetical protein PK218_06955 [Flavobacterium sp.]|nr:hypothetical protein [Flavobacterium sp.]